MIETMLLDDLAETGSVEIEDYVSDDEYILVIVSPTKGPADYLFEVTRSPK